MRIVGFGLLTAVVAALLALPGCGEGGGGDDGGGKADGRGSTDLAGDALPGDGTSGDAGIGDVRGGDAAPDGLAEELPPVPESLDYLVIAADDLLETAQGFAELRQSLGHVTYIVKMSSLIPPAAMTEAAVVASAKGYVKQLWSKRDKSRPFYLLLVGDANEGKNDPATTIPSGQWQGGWQGCYSDNFYADMDGDHVPDLAVGRIPVRTDKEGLAILERVKGHETSYEPGPWNHRIHVYAGEGDFGQDIDFFIETIAQKGLEAVPYEYDLQFAYRNPDSLYYYMPFEEKVLDLVTQGAVLVTYMGHGGGELDVGSLSQVVMQNRFPLHAFFACGTGDYIGQGDSDSEAVMKQAGGPISLLVSQTTTHPYGNALDALELEAAVFIEQAPTVGEAIRIMKDRTLNHTDALRETIDAFAVLYMTEDEIEDVPVDHLYSYNLLGDPATRIRLPEGKVAITAGDALLGQTLEVSGTVDNLESGTVDVALVCERAQLLHPIEPVEDPDAQASWPAVQANWDKVMDKTVVGGQAEVAAGKFSIELAVPDSIPAGQYYLTAYAQDGKLDAVGSVQIKLEKP